MYRYSLCATCSHPMQWFNSVGPRESLPLSSNIAFKQGCSKQLFLLSPDLWIVFVIVFSVMGKRSERCPLWFFFLGPKVACECVVVQNLKILGVPSSSVGRVWAPCTEAMSSPLGLRFQIWHVALYCLSSCLSLSLSLSLILFLSY